MASSPEATPAPDSNPPPAPPPPTTTTTPPPQVSPPAPRTGSPPPQQPSSPPPQASPPPATTTPAAPPPEDAQPPPPTPAPPPTHTTPPSSSKTPPPSSGTPPSTGTPPPPSSSSSPPPPEPSSSPSPPSPPSSGGTVSHSPPPPHKALSPPPPPPHSAKGGSSSPPSHSKGGSSSPSPVGSSSADVNVPLVVGVIAGVGFFFVLMLVTFLFCFRRKKKAPAMHYYVDHSGRNGSRPPPGSDYWNGGVDHIIKVVPPPPGMSPPGVGWHPPPPPPPLGMVPMGSSGGGETGSSAGFSGPRGPVLPPPSPNIALGFNKSTFTYEELAAATGGFSQGNLLGQGGFGLVHKGVLPNGKEIAVKSLKAGSGQGEREFQAEVEIISRVHHRHLVSLVGYCIAGGQRMLVYEFVPNKTLEYHLHGKDRPTMDFPTRLKIALGAAKGLAYLHEDCHPRIIHRDIKVANILLDYKFEAMVADFGLAKLSSDTHTHVSTRVMGTFGYLAPEYASSGKLTEKSDVFSYGVMLLELITGRRPVDTTQTFMEDSLVDWARPILNGALEDGIYDDLVDPRLENNYNPAEMMRLVACAAASVRHSARRRPKMSQIVRALEGDSSLEDLKEAVKTGHSAALSSDYDSSSYTSNMRKFRRAALASEEFASSEYGATSEYGLNPSASSSSGGNSPEMDANGNRRNNH